MPVPYFDAHCDTIFECVKNGAGLRENNLHLDLKRLGSFAPCAQVFAIWARPFEAQTRDMDFRAADAPPEILSALYERLLERLLDEFSANADTLSLCRTADDAKRAADDGKIAAFIAVEGAELLNCGADELLKAYSRGVRLVNLSWNYDNALCSSSRGALQGGLTAKGRDFVRNAQDIGVIVDLSHSSDKTFWDTLEIADKPVLAGHSNSRYIFDCPRSITDDMFTALIKNGGAAGLNFCADFTGKSPSVETLVNHAEHFLSLGGAKNVCLGGDLDGIDAMPEGIGGVQDAFKVYEAMLRRGWSEDLVRGIFYGNLVRVFEEAL